MLTTLRGMRQNGVLIKVGLIVHSFGFYVFFLYHSVNEKKTANMKAQLVNDASNSIAFKFFAEIGE